MRIVVKVGTSTLAHPTGRLNIQRMEKLCKVLSDLKNMGHEIILVSSGAIAMGFGKLNLSERPKDVPTKQASAAVGQCELMYIYDKLFTEYNHTVAQLLITAPDIEEGGVRKQNFHNTLALKLIRENPEYLSVLPRYTAKMSIHKGNLAIIPVADCQMSQWRQVLYHRNKVITPQIQGMLDVILEVAKKPF